MSGATAFRQIQASTTADTEKPYSSIDEAFPQWVRYACRSSLNESLCFADNDAIEEMREAAMELVYSYSNEHKDWSWNYGQALAVFETMKKYSTHTKDRKVGYDNTETVPYFNTSVVIATTEADKQIQTSWLEFLKAQGAGSSGGCTYGVWSQTAKGINSQSPDTTPKSWSDDVSPAVEMYLARKGR